MSEWSLKQLLRLSWQHDTDMMCFLNMSCGSFFCCNDWNLLSAYISFITLVMDVALVLSNLYFDHGKKMSISFWSVLETWCCYKSKMQPIDTEHSCFKNVKADYFVVMSVWKVSVTTLDTGWNFWHFAPYWKLEEECLESSVLLFGDRRYVCTCLTLLPGTPACKAIQQD